MTTILHAIILVLQLFIPNRTYAITSPSIYKPILAPVASSTAFLGQKTIYPTLLAYVDAESVKFGVNPKLSECIVNRESQWGPNKIGKEPNGTHSTGLWQINSRWKFPDASTTDPYWSTDWSLQQIVNGHVNWWSTYRDFCKNIPVLE